MRFHLIDRIASVEPGVQIRITKHLTLGEEYLADHFPTFPVMPGVLMLQTLVEACSWLLRITEDFRHSVIALREAKAVKYGSFMEPGRTMTATCEAIDLKVGTAGELATFKGKGQANGATTVSAKLTLIRYNLGDSNPALKGIDDRIINYLRGQLPVLQGEVLSSPGS
ncbi:MAG: hydroxymyristoyl-ACP dehydratase [Gemmataceae bacterium]